MVTSYGALCTDFYVNQKLAVKMDLPSERETILHLFDRVRKSIPDMSRFRRYEGEYALESSRKEAEYRWLALRRTSVRTGHVNPACMEEVYRFHRLILEIVPYHLTISPLDIDYIELLFGFDLECESDHDQVVFDALMSESSVADLAGGGVAGVLDCQPAFGISLSETGDTQAYFEVKTRAKSRRGRPRGYHDEPISVFVTIRRYGPVQKIEELKHVFDRLTHLAETLAAEKLVPCLLTPIARQITSSSSEGGSQGMSI